MGRIVGIDLGTTYSCVAVFNERKGVFEVLPNKVGAQTTPSVVAVNRNGEIVVGEAAKRARRLDPDNVVAEVKRHMGELGADGKPYAARFAGRDNSPEEISAYVLRELKESAERALGEPVTGAVITVPAYFEEPQRQATMRAGKLAGLDVKRIINEPTAAAIAYGHDQAAAEEEDEDEDSSAKPVRLLIYDLGGGTFDVSVIEVTKGNVRVKSTDGDHYLGGVDFDQAIAKWAAAQIKARYGVDLEALAAARGADGERGRKAVATLRAEAENYKKELSAQDTVTMLFPMLVPDPRGGGAVDVELELSRAEFEGMITTQIKRTLERVDHALADAKLKPADIDEVILVGGSTRIPLVKRTLSRHFGKEPRTDIHPDLCVALGAAHEALKHVDVSQVAPEVRGVVESKFAEMPTVVDVTGHSLGVAVQDGGGPGGPLTMSVLIPRQTPIPAMLTRNYSPASDMQTVVNIQVYQGEDRYVANNAMLREFTLENLPALPRGQVKIDVTFMLDANGVLTVTAKDPMSGRQREVAIHDVHTAAPRGAGLLPSAGASAPTTPVSPSVPQQSPIASGMAAMPANMPERFRKFVEQARELAPRLPPQAAARLKAAVDALYDAVQLGDPRMIENAGNALTDTLFDVRP